MAGAMDRLPSPALVCDLDAFEANVATAEALLAGTGTRLRPHVKTHRTPGLARRQLGGVATGVTCATVGEAEVMADAGITDVLVANEIVAPDKLARLAALATRARVTVAVDDAGAAQALGAAARQAGSVVDVLVDVDVGLHRCGVPAPADAVPLAAAVAGSAGLRLTGIMGYEGRVRTLGAERAAELGRAYALLAETRAALEAAGLEVGTVSSAGTSTLREATADPTVNEIQAGTYALMEAGLEELALPFRHAAFVLATVISRRPGQLVVDAGRKSLACDHGLPLLLDDGGKVTGVNEEHTIVAWHAGQPPPLGTRLALRPGHVRLTFNLHPQVWLARGEQIVDELPVSARGRSQ
jgi:D-serine deaminase-like pyridoxal phosphate-dependent protein